MDCALLSTFWAEAVSYAAYLRSWIPCKPSNNITDNLWYGKKKSHQRLQHFGCKVYCSWDELISKLNSCYNKGYLLHVESGTKSAAKTRDVIVVNQRQDGFGIGWNWRRICELWRTVSNARLEKIADEMDHLYTEQNLPAPVIIEPSSLPQLSPSPAPAWCRSACLQAIASQPGPKS